MRARIEGKHKYLGGLVVVALLAGGALASAGDERHPAATATDPAAVAVVAPEAPQLIAAFRREQREEDRLPGDPYEDLMELGDAQPGEQPGMARKLAFADGRAVHVWPMSFGICYGAEGNGGCYPTWLLRKNGIVAGSSFSSETSVVRVYGIARDGIDRATFTLGDGRRVQITVQNNGFIADVPEPQELEWTNVDGSTGRQSDFVPAELNGGARKAP